MTTPSALSDLLCRHDTDGDHCAAVALNVEIAQNDVEQPVHRHRKGQLVLALHGSVTCEVPQALWMVPPQHAVWIPGGMPHSNRATDNARICFLFIEPDAARMPQQCCTLAISPLVRELIQHLAAQPARSAARVTELLLELLVEAPVQQLHLPMSNHPKIRRMARALGKDPSDRTPLAEWAARLAMSERTLARLVAQETGLSFGRWRQQLHLLVALRQLSEGATVQQVAGNLGYDSVTAFITMFKKALGQPPGRYFSRLT
ncbi:AraC family transcriptional regulator [Comamonas antarctica]|uniref:Helix-turn-helix transcriptional regulator n=1 Tax=Comamonas antarctica TaxID=2743470 RepID=A0A6N1X304_9BURK|nr:helix-turn-helix transcriptional regulator [Comamonas antarctica]QKV52432.1 helix-turn-helix transcriptional regulator [Comamonas antarctica]